MIKLFGSEHGFSYKPDDEKQFSTSIVKQAQINSKNHKKDEIYIGGGEEGSGRKTSLCAAIAGLRNGTLVGNDEKREPNLNSRPTDYHARTVGEVAQAREEFNGKNGARSKFIKQYAKDALEGKIDTPFTEKELELMVITGSVPKGYNVHHKTPIFRTESSVDLNTPGNLEILPDGFHKDHNKELHWYENGKKPYPNGKGPKLGELVLPG